MRSQLIIAAERTNKRLCALRQKRTRLQTYITEDSIYSSAVLERKLMYINKVIRADKMRLISYNNAIKWMW